jgi:hypothetical protein
MNGTRQGDFSRLLFDPRKRFSAVRVQQGRVQLDADFNEATDILAHRLASQTADLLGESGTPAAHPGFGLTPSRCCLEIGLDQSFVLIGGSEGIEIHPPEGPAAGFGVEVRVLPRGEGPIFGCWVRREGDARFKPIYGLRIDGGRLLFHRPGVAELATGVRDDLLGRLHRLAVSWSHDETVLELDGEVVARDGGGVAVPHGPVLFLLGARQPPAFVGLLCELRLWRGAHTAEQRARLGESELDGGEPGLAGWWRFEREPGEREPRDERIPDRSRHGHEALVRGSASPPRWLPCDLEIGAGRFYLDGILCESVEPVPFGAQPDLPGIVLPQPRGREREHHLLYLDVWERSVSAIEEPAIREIALGGPDTTLRDQVVAQVRAMRLESSIERPTARELHEAWPRLSAPLADRGRLGKLIARRRHTASARLDNLLYRIEIHDGGDGHVAAVAALERVVPLAAMAEGEPGAPAWLTRVILAHWEEGWRVGQPVEVFRHGTSPQDPPRPLARVVALDPETQALTLDLDLGASPPPRVSELRLRRVATFKWSRSNASAVYPIAAVDPGNPLLRARPTSRGALGLEAGAWVELVDDRVALLQRAEPLHRVEKIDALRQQIALSPAPGTTGARLEHHPFLRLWDQQGRGVTSWGVVPATGGDWQEIEAAIQIRFGYDGHYRSGDYWLLPSRTLSQDVEWPRDARGAPRLLAPHGVDHACTPLALLTYEPEGFHLLDLRRTFQPYVTGAVSKAGDWMEGPLDVRAAVAVRGELKVEGDAHCGAVYGPLRSANAVDTPQLVDRSVTRAKLASGIGLVPDGYSILGTGAEAPAGYRYGGLALTHFLDDPRWVDRRQMPGGPPGPLASAALGGRVYTLLESGILWEYDPRADNWSRKADLPVPSRRMALAALGGRLYAAGGLDSSGHSSDRTFEYEPQTNAWTERARLGTARGSFALVACGGRLHALGGLRDSPSGKCTTARHEAYDPLTDTWSRRRPLPVRQHAFGGAALGSWIHAVGGEQRPLFGRWGRSLTNAHLAYNAQADRWAARRAALPTPRRSALLVETLGKLYAVGGESELGWLRDFECYDPNVDRWLSRPPLHSAIELPGAAAAGGVVYVTGALRAGGALIEECQVATKLYVHERAGEAPTPPPERSTTGTRSAPPVVTRPFEVSALPELSPESFSLQPLSR